MPNESPWEVSASEEIANLDEYFIISDEADFITIFNYALLKANVLQSVIPLRFIKRSTKAMEEKYGQNLPIIQRK